MAKPTNNYDFGGWATVHDIKCSDGLTIKHDAFVDDDGKIVPLLWQHGHHDPMNVLGEAVLEHNDRGVYTYCTFNNTESGRTAKELVKSGNIKALSIFANHLQKKGQDVMHGIIGEVSLVLGGANPKAFIDTVLAHSDGNGDSAVVYSGQPLSLAHSGTISQKNPLTLDELFEAQEAEEEEGVGKDNTLEHGSIESIYDTLNDEQKGAVSAIISGITKQGDISHSNEDGDDSLEHADEETVADVFETLSEKQKLAVYAIIGAAMDAEGGEDEMKQNAFDGETRTGNQLSHADMVSIIKGGEGAGKLSISFDNYVSSMGGDSAAANDQLAHSITDVDYLFPDATNVTKVPGWITRDMGWVAGVMKETKHTPFSRIKSVFGNLTEDEARARGYVKSDEKINQVFTLLKRTTTPQTVYKKQAMDRDDVIDITDFDVIAWLKQEMRFMLDEEIARAVLVGDGRLSGSDGKIQETNIRPVWTDEDLYTIKKALVGVNSTNTADEIAKAFIRAAVKARKDYKGMGNPTLYTTEDQLTDCLLMEDKQGRVVYESTTKLATALRVSKIVTVPVMEGLNRDVAGATHHLKGLIVNLGDYTIGADKGGSVNMFEDFDIDFNKEKYLIETRCSGALTVPYSAIALELVDPA